MGIKYADERIARNVTNEDVAGFGPGDYLEVEVQLPHHVDRGGMSQSDGFEEPHTLKGVLKETDDYAGTRKKILAMPDGQMVRGTRGEVGDNLVRIVKHEPAKSHNKFVSKIDLKLRK